MNLRRIIVNSAQPAPIPIERLSSIGHDPRLIQSIDHLLQTGFNSTRTVMSVPGQIYFLQNEQGLVISLAMIGPVSKQVDSHVPDECCREDYRMITNVVTHPNYQGQGLASLLVSTILLEASSAGITRIYLKVDPNNQPANHVYAKLGFTFKQVVLHSTESGLEQANWLEFDPTPCL